LAKHLDRAPEDVLVRFTRSLCLVRPKRLWASFSLDSYSGKFAARLGFELAGDVSHPRAASRRGASVTDIKWQTIGRAWLGKEGGILALDHHQLLSRLGAEDVYLTVGLSRRWQGEYWPLIAGVHTVPDYEIEVDHNGR
jgi:hypothetical protein